MEQIREKNRVSLLESKRKLEWDERENRLRKQKNLFRVSQGLEPLPDNPDPDAVLEPDPDSEKDDDELNISNKIELNEAAHILVDYIRTTRPRAAMLHSPGTPQRVFSP